VLSALEPVLLNVSDRPRDVLLVRADVPARRAPGRCARRWRCVLCALAATVLVTVVALFACLLARAPTRLTVGLAVTLLGPGSGVSLLACVPRSEIRWPLEPLIVGLLCTGGFGGFLIVEGARHAVLVGDEVATLIGLGTVAVPPILYSLVGRLLGRSAGRESADFGRRARR
jgi:hypothetical protein